MCEITSDVALFPCGIYMKIDFLKLDLHLKRKKKKPQGQQEKKTTTTCSSEKKEKEKKNSEKNVFIKEERYY